MLESIFVQAVYDLLAKPFDTLSPFEGLAEKWWTSRSSNLSRSKPDVSWAAFFFEREKSFPGVSWAGRKRSIRATPNIWHFEVKFVQFRDLKPPHHNRLPPLPAKQAICQKLDKFCLLNLFCRKSCDNVYTAKPWKSLFSSLGALLPFKNMKQNICPLIPLIYLYLYLYVIYWYLYLMCWGFNQTK